MRKVNADDKRQAVELTELDGSDWARAARHSQGHIDVAAEAGRARTCAPTRGLLLGDAGAFGLRVLTLRRNEKSSALGALPPCGCDMVAS